MPLIFRFHRRSDGSCNLGQNLAKHAIVIGFFVLATPCAIFKMTARTLL